MFRAVFETPLLDPRASYMDADKVARRQQSSVVIRVENIHYVKQKTTDPPLSRLRGFPWVGSDLLRFIALP